MQPWPNPNLVLRELLADLTEEQVVTRTGTDLVDRLPLIRTSRVGGGDDLVTDQPRMDIEVFAATAVQAQEIASKIQQRILRGRAATSAGILDTGRTEVGPREVFYPNPGVRRVTATYQLGLRRLRAPAP